MAAGSSFKLAYLRFRRSRLLQDFLCEVVVDFGLVADGFVVGLFQQLLAAIAQLFADSLLHARIFQLTLAGGSRG